MAGDEVTRKELQAAIADAKKTEAKVAALTAKIAALQTKCDEAYAWIETNGGTLEHNRKKNKENDDRTAARVAALEERLDVLTQKVQELDK